MSDSQDNVDQRGSRNRRFSPSARGGSVTMNGSLIVNIVLAAAALIAVGIAFLALGRADLAVEQARLMERESRLMKDDLKYIRAYLSARGIHVPADHDEAEEKPSGTQNHHLFRPQSDTGPVPYGGSRIVTHL